MGEQCDDGNLNDLDACSKVCTYTYLLCGDRALDEGEQCDDGNTLDGDGCSARCLSERCVEVDGEEICRVWLLEAEGEVSLTPPEGTGALGGDRPRFSVVRYRPTLRNAVSHAYTLAQGELRLSGDIGDALTPVSLSSFTPSEPVVEGEDLMSYPIDLDAWAIGESFRYRVSYTLSASAQVFGRTLSLGSDLFELDLNELVPSEAFDVSGAAAPGAQVVLQVAVVDPEVLELANISDPPCADDLDTSLTLTRSAGDVLVESDDVSATNLCSALYTLIDYEPCDTRPAGDIEACRARNRYHIKVSNRSLKTTSYQLQITLPELLCGNGALDFGEECDVNAPAPCDARCRLVTESP
jgi:cysteine-rich repeat protein